MTATKCKVGKRDEKTKRKTEVFGWKQRVMAAVACGAVIV